MLAVRCRKAHPDTEIGQFGMRVMPAVEFGYRFGIALAGLRLYQHAFLKMRFEQTLQRHKKSCAVMTVPIGIAAWHDLGIVDLHLDLGIARQRTVERVQQQVAVEALTGRDNAIELKLETFIVVQPNVHCAALRLE